MEKKDKKSKKEIKSKEKVLKVAMSIPSEGHTLPEAYDNHLMMSFHLGCLQELWKNEKRNPRYEFYWHTSGRLMTAMARERLINEAKKGGMDYILMYDDDMILPLDMVECMLQDMEQHPEIDILAPLAFMRNPPHYAVMYTVLEGHDPKRGAYYINQFVKNYARNSLVECDAVGFGAVLIKMSVIEKMKPPYCFSTTGSGEDIYFCQKAKKESGARIFMDTRIKLGHLAQPQIVDEEYFDKWRKKNKHFIPKVPGKYEPIQK